MTAQHSKPVKRRGRPLGTRDKGRLHTLALYLALGQWGLARPNRQGGPVRKRDILHWAKLLAGPSIRVQDSKYVFSFQPLPNVSEEKFRNELNYAVQLANETKVSDQSGSRAYIDSQKDLILALLQAEAIEEFDRIVKLLRASDWPQEAVDGLVDLRIAQILFAISYRGRHMSKKTA